MFFVLFRKNSKVQKRGKVNLIGRLQLSTEKAKQEENDGIVALRILRIQVLNVKYMKYHISCFTANCRRLLFHDCAGIDHFTVVAELPGIWLEARLPVTLF